MNKSRNNRIDIENEALRRPCMRDTSSSLSLPLTTGAMTSGQMIDKIIDFAEKHPGTEIPKPNAIAPFLIKRIGNRRGEPALIYQIPSHSEKSPFYEKGVTVTEFEKAYNQLLSTGEFTRGWFNSNLPACAKEGGCNYTTIGGVFELIGVAKYKCRGKYEKVRAFGQMNKLTEILHEATAGVEAMYFHLNVDGGDPIFRERVYCYELYHQMRKNWPADYQYSLNGELDKRAHPILREIGADQAKPDLLVHTPGNMAGNYAIIEVKHSTSANGIRKDLKTLDLFVRKVGYQRAIYLVYGPDANARGVRRIEAIVNAFQELKPI